MEQYNSEQYKTPEQQPIQEQEVIDALDSKGLEDAATKELLSRYADQCNAESNAKAAAKRGNFGAVDRANMESAIKLAELYIKTTRYRENGIESLAQVYVLSALNNRATQDIAEQLEERFQDLGVDPHSIIDSQE